MLSSTCTQKLPISIAALIILMPESGTQGCRVAHRREKGKSKKQLLSLDCSLLWPEQDLCNRYALSQMTDKVHASKLSCIVLSSIMLRIHVGALWIVKYQDNKGNEVWSHQALGWLATVYQYSMSFWNVSSKFLEVKRRNGKRKRPCVAAGVNYCGTSNTSCLPAHQTRAPIRWPRQTC